MAKDKKPKGVQLDSIPKGPLGHEITINLDAQDDFVKQHGVDFIHYKAIPSPIGIKERGDYRKIDAADVAASNGFIYKEAGCFTARTVSNSKSKNPIDGGLFDESTARLILPRFYNAAEESENGNRIHLAPGDRIFAKDVENKVPNYQRMTYNPGGVDIPQFPILFVEHLMDSQGDEYVFGRHFTVTSEGNIRWIAGQKNPGIDNDTGKGRVYGIRYLYNAHWYILSIPNEVRLGRATSGGTRSPQRMPYHAVIQREYVYHNQVNAAPENIKDKKTARTKEKPKESVQEYTPIQVNMNMVSDED